MAVIVSACLLGENCKYNGGNNYNEKLVRYLEGKTVIPVCPEVEGGLPTPRVPSEIVDGIVTNKEGKNVDAQFRKGVKVIMERIKGEDVECVILQSRSPSCGSKEIYDGTFSKRLIEGQGLFAKAMAEAGYKVIDIEDLFEGE